MSFLWPFCKRQTLKLSRRTAAAGQATLQALPTSLQEAIFRLCDNKSQHALAQTCMLHWTFYHELQCVPHDASSQAARYQTACSKWRRDRTREAAAVLAISFRADMDTKALDSSLFPDDHRCYHASLVGHLSQRHLRFMLRHPEPLRAALQIYFAEAAVAVLKDKLQLLPVLDDSVSIFTLEVYHSRQANFSDDELEQLGAIFKFFPVEVGCLLCGDCHMPAALAPVNLVCGPVWQLISPSKHANCMYWDMQADSILYVGDVSKMCSI